MVSSRLISPFFGIFAWLFGFHMRIFTFLFLLVYFLPFACVFAQGHQAEALNRHRQVLRKLPGDAEGQRNTDYILYTLATGNSRLLPDLRLTYDFETHVFIPFSGTAYAEIRLDVPSFNLEGDTDYRGFDISDLLIPDRVRATVNLSRTGSRSMGQLVEFSLQNTVWPLNVALVEQASREKVAMSFQLHTLGFSDEATERFTNRITEINNYWASTTLIDSLLTEINRKGVDNNGHIEDLFLFWDLSRKVKQISNQLLLAYADKETNGSLRERYGRLERMNTRLETLLLRELGKENVRRGSANSFSDRFIMFLQHQRRSSMRVDFYKSDIFYNAGRLMPDRTFVEHFSLFDDRYFGNTLVDMVYKKLILKGDSLRNIDDFAHAYDYYQDASQLQSLLPTLKADASLPRKMQQIREGLLGSFFRIAASAIEAGNTGLASSYQSKANDFLHEQPGSNMNIQRPVAELATSYQRRAETLLSQGKYAEAVSLTNEFEAQMAAVGVPDYRFDINQLLLHGHRGIYLGYVAKAQEHFKAGRFIEADEEINNAHTHRRNNMQFLANSNEAAHLERQIKEPVVGQVIDMGLQAYQSGNHSDALSNFMQAREQARNYELRFGINLDSLTSVAAKPLVLDHIRTAYLKIWANELDEAWEIYDHAIMLQNRFLLSTDRDIKTAIDDLDRRFIERICLNHQLQYNELMQRAGRMMNENRIENLHSVVDEAIRLVNDNRGCGIDPAQAMHYQQEFGRFFDYQERMNQVLQLIFNEGPAAAVEAYLQLDEDVARYQLRQFGHAHTSLDDFILSQRNNQLTFIALQRLIELGQAEKAYEYLQLLQQYGFDERASRNLQSQAGELMARHLFTKGVRSADTDWANNLRWYRTFRQAYSRTMNELNRRN